MNIITNRNTYYTKLLEDLSQGMMLFIMGPRQVGKTTLSQAIAKNYQESLYLNWDIDQHRMQILSGQRFVEEILPLNSISPKPIIIFDEIHKI